MKREKDREFGKMIEDIGIERETIGKDLVPGCYIPKIGSDWQMDLDNRKKDRNRMLMRAYLRE